MNRIVKILPLIFVIFSLSAIDAKADHYLISIHGGNGSCRLGVDHQRAYPNALDLAKNLEAKGHRVTLNATCYQRVSYNVNFKNARNEDVVLDRVAYAEYFNEIINRENPDKLILIGHSYGGWLSLFLAERLPKDRKIDILITIDPISQIYCTIPELLSRYPMHYTLETPKPGCQQAPADFGPERLRRIASRSGLWRHYFQNRTKPLRSGPISEATSNILLYNGEVEVPSDAHGLVIEHEKIWNQLKVDTGLESTSNNYADAKILSPEDIDLWRNVEKEKFNWAAFSEVSVRLRFVYQKAGFSLFPKYNAGGGNKTVATYNPNANPSIGLLAKLGSNAVFGISRNIASEVFGNQGKVKSVSANYFFRYVHRQFYFEGNYQRLEGFFIDRVNDRDVSPFRDSVFKKIETKDNIPGMKMTSTNVSAAWLHHPERISLRAMFTQMDKQFDSDASFIGVTSLNRTVISSPNDFIPDDLKSSYGDASSFNRIEISTIAVMPGVAFAIVHREFYLGGILAWGVAQRWLNISPEPGRFSVQGSAGMLTGTAGYFGDTYFAGLSGQKGIYSQAMANFGLTNYYSSAEIFAGRHF